MMFKELYDQMEDYNERHFSNMSANQDQVVNTISKGTMKTIAREMNTYIRE